MNSFLAEAASFIKQEYNNPSELTVVLPSHRASLFLKNELAKAFKKNFLAPKFITISDFIEGYSDLKKISGLDAVLKLYYSYEKVWIGKGKKAESIESFLKWGNTLLVDFTEIDQYLIDSKNIFSYVNEARAIETWNLNNEPLTENQIKYIGFWEEMGNLYNQFSNDLKEEKIAYSGLIYRDVAENLSRISEKTANENILFLGFNVLTKAEEKIIRYCIKEGIGKILWDSDKYYMDNPIQEAGMFLRRIKQNWFSDFNWIFNDLETAPKNIQIVNCNTNIAQSYAAANLLKNWYDKNNGTSTALILNNEELLLPTLYNLPDNVDAANITMGYSLKYTPLASFISAIIELWISAKFSANSSAYYHKHFLNLLKQPLFKKLTGGNHENLTQEIIKKNKVYIGSNYINDKLNSHKTLPNIFPTKELLFDEASNNVLKILDDLKEVIIEDEMDKTEKLIHLESIYFTTVALRKILLISDKHPDLKTTSIKLFKQIVNQHINKEKISFIGEPLNGLQIMGMLETRLLDFDNIIMLSVNEGTLPSGKTQQSFIPFDIRREFNLPTHIEKDAVYSYQFYRLLQRSKNIAYLYLTGSSDFGKSAEKSRFLEQIIYELPKKNPSINIEQRSYSPASKLKNYEVEIPINDSVQQSILDHFEHGISPSGLNTFLECPLDFYNKYVLKLYEQDEIEEKLKHSTFGISVHDTLELLYQPHLGKTLTVKAIELMKQTAHKILEDQFKKVVEDEDLKKGNNLIAFEVAKSYVNQFLNLDIDNIVKAQSIGIDYKILELEKKLELVIPIKVEGKTINVKIKGIIDRVDLFGNELRIIDYKTGKVEAKDISAQNLEGLMKKAKALQLYTYAFLYLKNNEVNYDFLAGIYSFKNFKEGLIHLKCGRKNINKQEVLDFFPSFIENTLNSYFEENSSISHNQKALYCEYC